MARVLARNGTRVIGLGRNREKLRALEDYGGEGIACDMSKPEDVVQATNSLSFLYLHYLTSLILISSSHYSTVWKSRLPCSGSRNER